MSWNNAKKTSVVSFFNLPPGEINRLLMNPKISVVINFEEFAIKVRSLLNHVPRDMDWKKVVAKMAEKCKVENQCDLVKFQAMMGFPVEEQQ